MLRKSEFENSRYQTLNLNAYWLNFTKFFFEPLISARSFLYDLHALNSLQFMMDGSDTCRNHFIRVFQLKIAMWIPSEIFPTRKYPSRATRYSGKKERFQRDLKDRSFQASTKSFVERAYLWGSSKRRLVAISFPPFFAPEIFNRVNEWLAWWLGENSRKRPLLMEGGR